MYITENNKKDYKSILLLNELINSSNEYKTIDNGDNKLLEPLFIEMMSKNYVTTSGLKYVATENGKKSFDIFMKRYQEYLKVYDIFSFVDLEKGEFAFSKYFDFSTDSAWDSFKSDSRFDDVRIAVAQFKKVDPSEIVFMSFINENRFDTKSIGWQMDILSDIVWNEIDKICETAIKSIEIGDDAMEDMIKQGADIMISLLKEEEKRKELQTSNDEDEVTTYVSYEPYYNPYYCNPIWFEPLFIW